jgi:hypothetical protein
MKQREFFEEFTDNEGNIVGELILRNPNGKEVKLENGRIHEVDDEDENSWCFGASFSVSGE